MLSPKVFRFVVTLSISLVFYKFLRHEHQMLREKYSNGFRSNFDKIKQTKDSVAYVTIAAVFIEPKLAPQQIQKFKNFLKNDGAKYSKIVVNLTHCRFEGNKISVASLFLQTLFIENIHRENCDLEPLQLYFHISSKIVLSSEENLQCSETTCFKTFLFNYLIYSRIISGVIFDSSLISSSFSKDLDTSEGKLPEIWKRISRIKAFSQQSKIGNVLNIGILIHSMDECVSILENVPNYVLSELDIAVYNEKSYKCAGSTVIVMEKGNEQKGFSRCNQIFLIHFPKPPLYQANDVLFLRIKYGQNILISIYSVVVCVLDVG